MSVIPSHISRTKLLGISSAIVILVGGVYMYRLQIPGVRYAAQKLAVESPLTCAASSAPTLTGGTLIEERTIEMDSASEIELVRTFKSSGNEAYPLPSSGLVIDVCNEGKWETVYRADADKEAPESIELDTLDTERGKALVVKKEYAGAGTSMEWEIIVLSEKKARAYPRGALIDDILSEKKYVFMGNNEVHTERNMVVETVPGYSDDAARCCPDLPSLKIFYQFTDGKIRVVSAEIVPGTPKR